MTRSRLRRAASLALAGALAAGAVAGRAGDEPADPVAAAAADVRAHLDAAEEALLGAAAALVVDDPPTAGAALLDADDEAESAVLESMRAPRAFAALRTRVAVLRRRIARAAVRVGGTDHDARPAVNAVCDAIVAGRTAVAALRGRGAPFGLRVEGGSASVARGPGARTVVRVRRTPCADEAAAVVANDRPAAEALVTTATPIGRDRFRIVWGEDAGTARVTVTVCGATRTARFVNRGPRGALSAAPPSDVVPPPTVYARVGSAAVAAPIELSGDGPFEFSVAPALPEGLALDLATGAVTGVALASGSPTAHVVTVRNVRGSATTDLTVDVDPALPQGAVWLAGGFGVEAVVRDAAFPAKLAAAPDGRLFFDELLTGNVRVVSAAGELDPSPVVTVPVLTGGERGLLGIALAPDFASSGAFYVYASTAADAGPGGRPERNRVLRYVLAGGSATGPEVVVDDLPIGGTQNAGALAFGPDGMLYVTVGDTGNALLAQDDASLAGRVLRVAPDGSVPADNPVAASPEWARGFRNPYGIAFHPATGLLFATENGPTAHDELDLVQRGRNFEWGADPETSFGALRGIRIIDWTPVIVPTGIAIHPGTGSWDDSAGDLFVGSYDQSEVRRIRLSGIDFDSEESFLRLSETGGVEKPLDVVVAPDGALWVSTFTTVWRVTRD